jgi:hypothetical protein
MLTNINAERLSENLGKHLGKSLGKYVGKKPGKNLLTTRYVKIGAIAGIVGIAAVAIGFVARDIYRRSQNSKSQGRVDAVRDKTLKDSFPASDPPASQYFDIPVNRQ